MAVRASVPDLRFCPLVPPVRVLNRIRGASEEAYVDLSTWTPREAKYALILASCSPSGLNEADRLEVGHGIYDNLIDYNVYGNINLLKPAGTLDVVRVPWVLYAVALENSRYAYDITGTFGQNSVLLQHWLIGFYL